MSISAILPVSSIDFSATTSQQTAFNNLLNQLQQAVGKGDLTTTGTLLNALDSLSPSSGSTTAASPKPNPHYLPIRAPRQRQRLLPIQQAPAKPQLKLPPT